MNRRTMLQHSLTALTLPNICSIPAQIPDTDYRRADFGIIRDTGYGVGFHWTASTVPRRGRPKPFADAVRQFDIDAFVDRVAETGAGHVLFTVNHGIHRLCCPNPEVDRLLKGRTTDRDLVMELADALAVKRIRLMLYYSPGWDDTWKRVSGFNERQPRFFENWIRIVAWMGQHYGNKLSGWWFDDGAHMMRVGTPPWKEMTTAAKTGFGDRLVCYNGGIENITPLTPYQDYWAGEVVRLNYIPRGPTAGGLPWYSFTTWHGDSRKPRCGQWVMDTENAKLNWPAPPVQSIVDHYQRFRHVGGTVTFNLLCYQDGHIYDSDLEVMRTVRQWMKSPVAERRTIPI